MKDSKWTKQNCCAIGKKYRRNLTLKRNHHFMLKGNFIFLKHKSLHTTAVNF